MSTLSTYKLKVHYQVTARNSLVATKTNNQGYGESATGFQLASA